MKTKRLALSLSLISMAATMSMAQNKAMMQVVPSYDKSSSFPLEQIEDITVQPVNEEISREKIVEMLQTNPSELCQEVYPMSTAAWIQELLSDNMVDNNAFVGTRFHSYYSFEEDIFAYKGVGILPSNLSNATDSPQNVWFRYNESILMCNKILSVIEGLSPSEKGEISAETLNSIKGELLVCRAWIHMSLAGLFAPAWRDDAKNATTKAIPYFTQTETDVNASEQSLSVKDFYDKMESDLLSGLALIGDAEDASRLGKKAAYAIAARLYLQERQWQKVLNYTNLVLGSDPASMLREQVFQSMESIYDRRDKYYDLKDPANLFVQDTYSMRFRMLTAGRFATNGDAMKATIWGPGPKWNSTLPCMSSCVYIVQDQDYGVYYFKGFEEFEYTDEEQGIGYVHNKYAILTAEETLLMRAEAKYYLADIEGCLADLNIWLQNKMMESYKPMTLDEVVTFYTSSRGAFALSAVSPQDVSEQFRLPVVPGYETYIEPLLQCILHFRRIETTLDGLRWTDIKRYGMNICHPFAPVNKPISYPSVGLESTGTTAAYQQPIPTDELISKPYVTVVKLKNGESESFNTDCEMLLGITEEEYEGFHDQISDINGKTENGWAVHTLTDLSTNNLLAADSITTDACGKVKIYEQGYNAYDVMDVKGEEEGLHANYIDGTMNANGYTTYVRLIPLGQENIQDYYKKCITARMNMLPFSQYTLTTKDGNRLPAAYRQGILYMDEYLAYPVEFLDGAMLIVDKINGDAMRTLRLQPDNVTLVSEDGELTLSPNMDGIIRDRFMTDANLGVLEEGDFLNPHIAAINESLQKYNTAWSVKQISFAKSTGANAVNGIIITAYTNSSKSKTNTFGIKADWEIEGNTATLSIPLNDDGSLISDKNFQTISKTATNLPMVMKALADALQGEYTLSATGEMLFNNRTATTGSPFNYEDTYNVDYRMFAGFAGGSLTHKNNSAIKVTLNNPW